MNSKALKIIAIILAVTTVAGIAAFFITRGGGDGGILPDIVKPEEFSFADSKYTTSASLSVKGANGEIYLPRASTALLHRRSERRGRIL